MKRFIRLLFMPCEGVTGLVSEALDRDLTRAERIAVRIHMVYCSACRRFRKQVRQIRESLSRAEDALAQAGQLKLSQQARAKIIESLKQ